MRAVVLFLKKRWSFGEAVRYVVVLYCTGSVWDSRWVSYIRSTEYLDLSVCSELVRVGDLHTLEICLCWYDRLF